MRDKKHENTTYSRTENGVIQDTPLPEPDFVILEKDSLFTQFLGLVGDVFEHVDHKIGEMRSGESKKTEEHQNEPPKREEHQNEQPSGDKPHTHKGKASTPFEVLGLSPNCTRSEARKRWGDLAQGYHPDKVAHLGPELREVAARKMLEINAAYESLRSLRGW
jgi:hypothetical protein